MSENPDGVAQLMRLELEYVTESVAKFKRLLELTDLLHGHGLWGPDVDEFADLREFSAAYAEFKPCQWWQPGSPILRRRPGESP
jgi:hypothetical protein